MMEFYKGFSHPACRALRGAVEIAGECGVQQAHTGHLLLAILRQNNGCASVFLRTRGVSEAEVEKLLAGEKGASALRLNGKALSPELRKTMEFAVVGARSARVRSAGTEHLLCAMLEDGTCVAGRWLARLGVVLPQAARECRQLSGQMVAPAPPRNSPAKGTRPSDKYTRDLTRMARDGALDPVLCREEELARMEEILCRRQKNNPCLVGEPGVGKTALVEALAQRMAGGVCVGALGGKRLLALCRCYNDV